MITEIKTSVSKVEQVQSLVGAHLAVACGQPFVTGVLDAAFMAEDTPAMRRQFAIGATVTIRIESES